MPYKKPHPLYGVWQGIISRCERPSNKFYHHYGGRGISVCERWSMRKGEGFRNFLADMGERPEGTSIDRIDNDGNYEPANCRWATRQEQQRNRRTTVKITIEGITYIAVELAEKYGFKTDSIVKRAKVVSTFDELVNKQKRVYRQGLAMGGIASGAKKQAMTHCKNGHEFTPENTGKAYNNGKECRSCKKCHAIRERARNAFKKLRENT